MENVKVEQFGKDHWSLLAYMGTRVVSYSGRLDIKHMRVKNPALRDGWKQSYGTRLHGYWNEDKTTNENLRLPDHDDLDCFDDLENAGFIENKGTGLNPACKLTNKGLEAIKQLTLHKQEGKHYSSFVYKN